MGYSYPRLSDTLQQLRRLLQTYREAGGEDAVLLFHDAAAGREAVQRLATGMPERVIPIEVEEVGSVGMDVWLAALAYGAAAVRLLATPWVPAGVLREVNQQLDVAQVQTRLIERGVWLRPFGKLLYTMPPYVISDDELVQVTGAMQEVAESL